MKPSDNSIAGIATLLIAAWVAVFVLLDWLV